MADKFIDGVLYDLGLLDEQGNADSADKKAVLRYLNEGRCLIANLNPSFYGVRKTYKLDEGNVQQFCECETITKIIGQSKDDTCKQVRRFDFPENWGCDTDYPFKINKAILNDNDSVVHVEPPVPAGTDVYLVVECLPKLDDIGDSTDFNACRDGAALTQWALYRATLADGSDENALALAQMHLGTFSDLTSIKLKVLQSTLRSELLKRQLGDE